MQRNESNQTAQLNDLEKEKALQFLTGILQMARLLMRVFFLVGMGASVFGGILLWKALSSQTWPSVKGRIVSASIEKESIRRRVVIREKIQYVYHVKGKRFVGESVTLSPRLMPLRPPAREVVRKYPKGAHVTVFYNPSRPEESVLEPGLNPYIMVLAAVGPFILLVVTMLFRYSVRFENSVRSKLQPSSKKDLPPKAPIPSTEPNFEPTRKWIMVLLTALLLVLLAMQFYGDDIKKWVDGVKKERGVQVLDIMRI